MKGSISPGLVAYMFNMSCAMRKPPFCICKIKDEVQLHGKRAADQCLCFCYRDSTIHVLPMSKISSL